MATRPDYMKDAVRVDSQRPAWMADAVPVGEAPPAPEPGNDETEGILGHIGDFLVGLGEGDGSEFVRSPLDNARSGAFAQDAARNDGFLDRAGSLLERGAAWVDQGAYNFLGALGSAKARKAAADIAKGTVNRDVAGTTTWDDVSGLGSLGNFIADTGIESAPSMALLAQPLGVGALGAAQTGNIGAQRAANDGRDQTTDYDLLDAAPWALGSTALDRFGFGRIVKPGTGGLGQRVARAAGAEGLTEGVQSQLEYAGGNIGTKKGYDFDEASRQFLPSVIAGAGTAGGIRGGVEIANPLVQKVRINRLPTQPGKQGPIDDETFDGSLDDLMQGEREARPDYMKSAVPVDRPTKPGYMDDAVPVSPQSDAGGAPITTPELERARQTPVPVDDGGAIARSIFGDSARITSTYRGPDHPLSKKNPRSYHTQTRAAVDMVPIDGMTFDQAKAAIEAQGYTLIEAIDETGKGRTKHATGDHWHFVIGQGGGISGADVPDAGTIDVPGADGVLLNRGDQRDIAGSIELPDMPQAQRDMAKSTPIELPELQPARATGNASQVTTARGQAVDTQFELRDLPELIPSSSPDYDQLLQPRDRASRRTSDAQVGQIAAALDPAQLADSRLASTGAPIIGPDGQVESGNGRIAAIERAYQTNPERAQAYRQMIEAQGFDTSGMQNPVLVRRRTTAMTPEQRQAWTRAANERDTMAMSSTEQAASDARALDDVTLGLYRGGPVTAAANRDFVRAFIDKAVSPAERNAMTASDGSISADGVRRVRFALLARAYDDTELISRISEDTDTNIAAIGKALLDAAPAFARMKAKIASGELPAQYDITDNIAEAARMVSRSRETGQSLQRMLAQTDAFADRISPETEQVLYLMFRDAELKRPRSQVKVADALIDYANRTEAIGENERQGPDMFGNAPNMPSPAVLLQQARGALDGDQEAQGDLLTSRNESATVAPDEQTDRPSGEPAQARPDQGEPDGGSRGAVPTLARGQLRALGIAQELRTEKSAALVGRTAATPKELAEIAQIYRDPRYETFRIFYTKGDEIVHATGVSSRSIAEAPLMPSDVDYPSFIAGIKETMQKTGADGYYLLHNHPSGDPDPSSEDKVVTRRIASRVDGFRGHVVINSNRFATITTDAAGRSRAKLASLDLGEDRLNKPSVPHNALGSKVSSAIHLAVLAKGLQKPGYVTVIGTSARQNVRVIVEYPADIVKRDAKALMGMARRIMRQSGSQNLFLIGDSSAVKSPAVSRALSAGIVTAALDESGQPVTTKVARKNKMPIPPGRYVAEDTEAFRNDPTPKLIDKLVDSEGITRDVQAIRNAVGNPFETLGQIADGSMSEMYRSVFYSMDSRMRVLAKRFDSPSIDNLANMFHAEAGKTDNPVGETYHEAVEREGFGRASRAWRILEPYFDDKAAMNRIGLMLRDPTKRQTGARRQEAEAARDIARLLKDTIDYRKKAGEEIGEVTDGYFPRWLDVEKVMAQRDLFLRQATALYKKHGAENPDASAKAWQARIFDQYAGLDGGVAYAGLFRDARPAGVGRKTAKERQFGKDADQLLGEFYNNDTGEVLTSYFIGAARKAEEARRFGDDKLERMMNRIKREMRSSGEDAGDALESIAKMIGTNLGRADALGERMRAATSILHTAGQLGTLDRATFTSLSESMMGFVRAGPRYGLSMVKNSVREFVNQIKGGNRSEVARLAEALGIIEDVMVGDTLAARAGFERSQTTARAAKVQRGFYKATGLHQWTEGTRAAATQMAQAFLRNNAEDALRGKKRAVEAFTELGIKDTKAFAEWLSEGGKPTIENLTRFDADSMHEQYRTALMRFVNQTIMKPTKAQKPRWASTPYGALVFSLMSFSYGFKKNVLDRTGRLAMKAAKEGDPTLLYPAFGLAALLAVHTVINSVLRQAFFGGGREDDDEGLDWLDVAEAVDRAGLTGAASRPLNALFGLRYRNDPLAAMFGPVIGRPFDLGKKVAVNAVGESLGDSPNTNTAERAAAGAVYDVVLEPALEAYGVTRFKPALAAVTVWGSGNREGGIAPADRDMFVNAVAGEKTK